MIGEAKTGEWELVASAALEFALLHFLKCARRSSMRRHCEHVHAFERHFSHVPAATKLGACFNCEGVSCQTLLHPPTLPEQRTQSDYECCCSRKGGAGVDAASSADRVL